MKKAITIFVLCTFFALLIEADTTIGQCTFYGEQPPHSMSMGTTIIYYYEMSASSMIRSGVEYRKCRGDVWVIYKSASEARRLQFQTTNGSVQICNNY